MNTPSDNPSKFLSIIGLEEKVLFVSSEERIEYVNSSFCSMAGRSREELFGQSLSIVDHFPFGDGALGRLAAEAKEQAASVTLETSYYNPSSGAMEHVRISAAPHKSGIQFVFEDRSDIVRLERMFQRYVGPKLLEQMRGSNLDFTLPRRSELSILFVDLRGFTALSEKMNPDDVRSTINAYLEEMIRIVTEFDGTVDKIIGDAVMAFFGAPVAIPDHSWRALRCAAAMIRAQQRLTKAWQDREKVMPPCSVGVAAGEVVVGNIGSQMKQDYTVIGHAVNLASRLCDAAKPWQALAAADVLARAELQRKELGFSWNPKEQKRLIPAAADRSFGGKSEGVEESPDAGKRIRVEDLEVLFLDRLRVKGVSEAVQLISVAATDEIMAADFATGIAGDVPVQQVGIKTFGDYDLLQLLGRGGMGIVYRARHRLLGREVALKMLMGGDQAGKAQIDRFLQETKATARLQHPNIIRIYEVGAAESYRFFTMELVDGIPLDHVISLVGGASIIRGPESSIQEFASRAVDTYAELRSHVESAELAGPSTIPKAPAFESKKPPSEKLTTNQRITIVRKVLDALSYAHEHGIIHRDVKPGNIMLSRSGEPMLMDFGLAHARGEGFEALTIIGSLIGTTAYMAPEQAESRNNDVDETSDVYAAGAVLYELLTGRRPYEPTGNLGSDLIKISREDPPRPRVVNPTIAEDIETIILKAMEKEKRRRYPTAAAFAADLNRYLNNEPISARPPSVAYAIRKSVARHPGIYATVALALFALVTLAATSYVSIRRERNDAVAALKDARYQAHLTQGIQNMKAGRLRDAFSEFQEAWTNKQGWEVQAQLGQLVNLRAPLHLRVKPPARVKKGTLLSKANGGGFIAVTIENEAIVYDSAGLSLAARKFTGDVSTITASLDTSGLVGVGFADGTLMLVDAKSLRTASVIRTEGCGEVHQIAFGPRGEVAASFSSLKDKSYTVKVFRDSRLTPEMDSLCYSNQRMRLLPPIGFNSRGNLFVRTLTALYAWNSRVGWRIRAELNSKDFPNQVAIPISEIPQGDNERIIRWITNSEVDAGALAFAEIPETAKTEDWYRSFVLDGERIRNISNMRTWKIYSRERYILLEGIDGAEIWRTEDNSATRLYSHFTESLWPHGNEKTEFLDFDLAGNRSLAAVGDEIMIFAPFLGGIDGGWDNFHTVENELQYQTMATDRWSLAYNDQAAFSFTDGDCDQYETETDFERDYLNIIRYDFKTGKIAKYRLLKKSLGNYPQWPPFADHPVGFAVNAKGNLAARLFNGYVLFFDLTQGVPGGRYYYQNSAVDVFNLPPSAVADSISTLQKYTYFNEIKAHSLELSPDGNKVVIVSKTGEVEVLKRGGDRRVLKLLPANFGSSASLTIAAAGTWNLLAIGSNADSNIPVCVWRFEDLAAGRTEPLFTLPPRCIRSIAIHPHLPRIYVSSADDAIEEWDVAEKKLIRRIPGTAAPMAVSADGSMFLAARSQAQMVPFDVVSSDNAATLMRAPWQDAKTITRGGFSPDGRVVFLNEKHGWVSMLRTLTLEETIEALEKPLPKR